MQRIHEYSFAELCCALDDIGFDVEFIIKNNLTLEQVREIYNGLLRWQLKNAVEIASP